MDEFFGWYNYNRNFDCPNIPTRMKNAITAELNQKDCLFSIPHGVIIKERIPNWLVIKWIEDGCMKRLPKIGVKTVNDTLEAILHCLSE